MTDEELIASVRKFHETPNRKKVDGLFLKRDRRNDVSGPVLRPMRTG